MSFFQLRSPRINNTLNSGAPAGPQTYFSNLSGTLSFTGAKNNQVIRAQTGVLSFTGAFTKNPLRILTASLSFTGAFIKIAVKALTAVLSFAGVIVRLVSKPITAVLSFSGNLAKALTKIPITAALSFTGVFTKAGGKVFTGVLSFSGAIARANRKTISGVLTFTGLLNRFITRSLPSAVLSFSGSMAKTVLKAFSGVLSFSGTISRLPGKSLTAALSFSGSLAKSIRKGLVAAALSFSGAMTKTINRALAGVLSFTGNFATNLVHGGTLFTQALTGGLSFTGTFTKTGVKALTGFFSATVDMPVIYNGTFESAPSFTAATNVDGRWIDGTAGGSVTNNTYGWLLNTSAGNQAQFDSSTSHSGTYSLKAQALATGTVIEIRDVVSTYNSPGGSPYRILLVPGKAYTVTYYMRTNYVSGDSNHGAIVALLTADATGNNTNTRNTGTYIKTTTGWTQYTFGFTANANESYAHIELRIYGHTGAGTLIMDAWYDDISITMNTPYTGFIKTTNKVLSGVLSFTGSVARGIYHGMIAALSFTGAVAKRGTRTFTGALSFTGAFIKQPVKSLIARLFGTQYTVTTNTIPWSFATNQQGSYSLNFQIMSPAPQQQFFTGGANRLDVNTEQNTNDVFVWFTDSTNTGNLVFKSGNLYDGRRHNLIVNKTATAITAYLDGVSAGVLNTTLNAFADQSNFVAGDSTVRVDHVRVWNRALTGGEVTTVATETAIPSSGLRLEWLLDEQTSTTAIDTSGNGNNGTVVFSGGWIAGGLTKLTSYPLAATLSFTGAIQKAVTKILSAAGLSFVGSLVKSVGHKLTGALSFTGIMLRRMLKSLTSILSFTSTRTNLITNPSFEAAQAPWQEYHNPGPTPTTLTLDNTTAQVGSQSLKMVTAASGNAYAGTVVTINNLINGRTYMLSLYAKGNAGGEALNFYNGANWVETGGAQVDFTLTTSFVRYSASFVCDTTTKDFYIRSSTASATFWIDAVLLEPVSTLGSYFDGTTSGAFWSGSINASISYMNQLPKFISRTITGGLPFTGAVFKNATRFMSGALSFTGSFARRIAKIVTGSLSFAGSVARNIARSFSASLSFMGTLLSIYHNGSLVAVTRTRALFMKLNNTITPLKQKNSTINMPQKSTTTPLKTRDTSEPVREENNNTHLRNN